MQASNQLDFINGQWVCKLVAGSARDVAVDIFGWDVKEMWPPAVGDETLMDNVAEVICCPMTVGFLPEKHRETMAGGRQVPLSKFPKAWGEAYCHWQCLATPSGAGTAGSAQG